jgi:DMSO/TMAO reductase YedYZ heme-binding membrane subunit/cytochrome b involved in lipid metabolism
LNNRYIILGSLVFFPLFGILEFFAFPKSLSLSAILGTIFLVLTLVPPNINSANTYIKILVRERRSLGVNAGILFFIHALIGAKKYLPFPLDSVPNINFLSGMLANYIILILLFTSFFGIRQFLKKKWNYLHALVWTLLPLVFFHALLNLKIFEGTYFSITLLIYGLLIIFGVFKFMFNNKDMKRDLIFLVLGFVLVGGLIVAFSSQVSAILGFNSSSSSASTVSSSLQKSSSQVVISQTSSSLASSSKVSTQSSTLNQSSTAQTSGEKVITSDVLAKNNSASSCYMAYQGVVFDLTSYINSHPGGKEILEGCGRDIAYLENIHAGPKPSSQSFQNILKGRNIGVLQN